MSNTPKAYHGYFGGKNSIGKNFITHYTPKNFKIYVEPFSGSYAVYFFTPMNDDVKAIYNDFNKDQANLFYCSKNYDEFLEKLNYHLNDENGLLYCKHTNIEDKKTFYKELYYSYKKSDFSQREFELGDYDRASVYAFLLTSAFNSVNYMAGGYSGFNKDKIKISALINKLNDEYIRDRFDKIVEIYSMDFEELIKKYDSPDTYFYLDPPYYTGNETEDKGNRVGWYGAADIFDKASHKRLCDLLKTLKGKWALSYYDFDLLHEWLPEDEYVWKSKDFFRSSASFSETKETKGTELLIMNYKLTDEEIEENKKFLTSESKPKTNKKTSSKTNKTTETVVEKTENNVEVGLDLTKTKNNEKITVDLEKYSTKTDTISETVSEPVSEPVNKTNKTKKQEDIDDFWLN